MNKEILYTAAGLAIPFLGTTAGAAAVLLFKGRTKDGIQKTLLGFASGVMVAASIWSLLIPAIEMSFGKPYPAWLPPSAGFILGVLFLLLLDCVMPHIYAGSEESKGIKSEFGHNTMLFFAVTLHNLPEGMAVGVLFASYLYGNSSTGLAAAFALSIGIALQNTPEGAVISLPLYANGMNKRKAFLYGILSGLAEPIGAVLTIFTLRTIVSILAYVLSFAAGAMLYVVVEELVPNSQSGKHCAVATLGFTAGFIIMMILDVALS